MSGVPAAMRKLRVLRDTARALTNAGFLIDDAWHGARNVRVRVTHDGLTGTITVPISPTCRDDAPRLAVQNARRAVRGAGSRAAS